MRTLAVVIARGGSKGLPGKALRPLGGKPLVAHSLEHALASSRVDQVILSSDSHAILDVGRSMGVSCVLRDERTSHDTATVDSAVRHAVEAHDANADAIAILYGNIARRPADLTDRAIDKLVSTGCDSVQSVYRVGKTHPLWMRRIEDDRLVPYQPNTVYRRQDLPPVYMLSGGALVVTRAALFTVDAAHPHAFLGNDRRAVVHDEEQVIDVDSELDLRLAQAMLGEAE